MIARMDDEMTGVPVLIEAGLGNTGTLAAGELVGSEGLSADMASEQSCRGKKNFEALIETQIIDTKSGPPHVLCPVLYRALMSSLQPIPIYRA